jgi:hypothetical protein
MNSAIAYFGAWAIGFVLAAVLGQGLIEGIILGGVFSTVVALVIGGRGEVRRFETSATPQQVVNSAVTILGTHKRWAVTLAGDSNASFSFHRPPSKLVAFCLLLMFIWPGIIYLVLAGKKESFTVTALPGGTAETMVQATSNGGRGKKAGRELERQIAQVAVRHQVDTTEASIVESASPVS